MATAPSTWWRRSTVPRAPACMSTWRCRRSAPRPAAWPGRKARLDEAAVQRKRRGVALVPPLLRCAPPYRQRAPRRLPLRLLPAVRRSAPRLGRTPGALRRLAPGRIAAPPGGSRAAGAAHLVGRRWRLGERLSVRRSDALGQRRRRTGSGGALGEERRKHPLVLPVAARDPLPRWHPLRRTERERVAASPGGPAPLAARLALARSRRHAGLRRR